MVWNAAEEERLEEEAEALLTERYEIADEYFFKKKFLKNLADPQLKRLLGTPLLLLPEKERGAYYQLFIDDNEAQDFAIIDGKRYNRQVVGLSLADVIRRRLFEFNANLNSDSFEITPIFSSKNNADIMTGFIAFTRDPNNDHCITNIRLFSFDTRNESFRKQVWEEFNEQIVKKLRNLGLSNDEVYSICSREFPYINRVELLKAAYGTIGDYTPIIGHYDEHGITVLTAEEEKL